MPKSKSGPKSKLAPKPKARHNLSPRVAERLAEVVRELREEVWGEAGSPEWGTRFTEIESEGMSLGLEVARLFMEQSVDRQSRGEIPAAGLEVAGEMAQRLGVSEEAKVETQAGEVVWEQPITRLSETRREFFPSGPSTGAGCGSNALAVPAGENHISGRIAEVLPAMRSRD